MQPLRNQLERNTMDRPFLAYKGSKPYVFVSYSHRDTSVVYPELTALRDSGFNVWYDEGIEAGTEWSEDLASRIAGAKLFLYFVTPESAASQNCRNEVNYALGKEIPTLTVHLKKTDLSEGLVLSLSARQAILKHEMSDQAYRDKIQDSVSAYVGKSSVAKTPVTPASSKNSRSIWLGLAFVAALALGIPGYQRYVDSSEESLTEIEAPFDWEAKLSIAVLPFSTSDSDSSIRQFADDLTEEIAEKLPASGSIVDGEYRLPKVASDIISAQLANPDTFIEKAGQLGVLYVLDGGVRSIGEQIVITIQLIRASDGFQVWFKKYELSGDTSRELQTDLARNATLLAVNEMAFDIEDQNIDMVRAYKGIAPKAVKLLRAADHERFLAQVGEGGDWNQVLRFQQQAIDADPKFELAYRSLANTYMNRFGNVSVKESGRKAHAAIDKAISLNDQIADSYLQRGQIYLLIDGDYKNATQAFETCLRLDLTSTWCHYRLAVIALRENGPRDALMLLNTSARLNAGYEQSTFLNHISATRLVLGDFKAALEEAKSSAAISVGGQKNRALRNQAVALRGLGKEDEPAALRNSLWQSGQLSNPLDWVPHFVRSGKRDISEQIINDYESGNILGDYFEVAQAYLALGDLEATFRAMEEGLRNHDEWLINSLRLAPVWNEIRNEVRYQKLLDLLDSMETRTDVQ